MIATLKQKSDVIGAFASFICMIHCLATPFLFIASACSKSCCASAPTWWIWLDFIFLFISFFAVYRSTNSTSKTWIKPVLWTSWIALLSFILIEHNSSLVLSNFFKYISALSLAGFHIYNMKYCQCENDECCVTN